MIENSEKIVRCFKILYIIGIVLVIASFFSEWYYYAYIINETTIWGYNIVIGWNCLTNNSKGCPGIVEIDVVVLSLYVFIFVFSAISFFYISLEHPLFFSKKDFYNKVKTLNYIFPANLGFNLIILALFLFNLFQANFYFPFLKLYIISENSETLYYYWLGPGCILHIISFIFMFPFSAIVLQIPRKFKLKENKVEIDKVIEESTKKIDFDKIIMKERIKKDTTFNRSSNGKLQKGKFNLDNIMLGE